MMKNITLGQYYPVDSWVHRLDPRTKILLTIAMIVAVFMVKSLVGYALVLGFVYLSARMAKIPFRMLVKGVKALRFILILPFLLNLFFNNGTTMLVEWGFLKITLEGLNQAIHYSLRLIFLVMGTSLMTSPGASRTTRRRPCSSRRSHASTPARSRSCPSASA